MSSQHKHFPNRPNKIKGFFSDFQIKFICVRHVCDEIEVRKSSISTDEMQVALNRSPQSQNYPTENHAKHTQEFNATSFIQSFFIIYFPFIWSQQCFYDSVFFQISRKVRFILDLDFFFKYLEKFDLFWI